MASLSEIRAQYPQYSDLNDQQLLDGLHRKFYSDMPRQEFDKKLGVPQVTAADVAADVGEQSIRGFNRGLNSILSLPGAIVGGAVNLVAPGQGDRFKWENPVSEFMSSPQAQPKTTAGRYADSIGQAAGASAIPYAGVAAKAAQPVQQAARTTLGQVGQQMVNAVRANPGGALAADVLGSVGSGTGQQAAEDAGFGPVGQMIGGMAGAVAPTAFFGAAQRAAQPIRRAAANQGRAGAYGSVAEDLPHGGVDAFADQVAVGGSRGSAAINRRTLDILGEEMERAGGNVPAAQAAAVQRISTEFGVTPQTARTNIRSLSRVHEDSPLMLGEYSNVAQSDAQRMRQAGNVDLDELGRSQTSATQGSMDYLANRGNARSSQTVRNAVGRRQEDLSPNLRGTLENMSPQLNGRAATIEDTPVLVANARQAAQQEYRLAAQQQRSFAQPLQRVLNAWDRQVQGRTSDISRTVSEATNLFYDPIQTVLPNGRPGPTQMRIVTDLQDFINRRTQLRRMIDDSYRVNPMTGTEDPTATTYWLERFRRHVDRTVGANNPQWLEANRRWSDMNLERRAQRLGDIFAKSAGPRYRQHREEFLQLAPEAQDIVRIHWLQQQFDKLANLPDNNSVAKLFSSDQARSMVRDVLGDDAAVALTRAVRDLRVAESTQRMIGGSQTHVRGEVRKQKDMETGLLAAAEQANAKGIIRSFLDRSMQILTERRNRPMADILTTPMNDTARVAQHLHNMRMQQNRLQQFAPPIPMWQPSVGQMAPVSNVLTNIEDGRR